MIVTFGGKHVAQDGTPLRDRFYRTDDADPFNARLRAFSLFGDRWGFLYATEQAAGVDDYGLTEFDIADGWLLHSVPAHRVGAGCTTCDRLDITGQRIDV